ncbi:hypothetical protein ABEY69_23630 [Priestia filamentosa]|uniref:hypothetical protein n=1 Tax=Priestia filamentosa TaxID=1402861 RepID=UPI0030B82872
MEEVKESPVPTKGKIIVALVPVVVVVLILDLFFAQSQDRKGHRVNLVQEDHEVYQDHKGHRVYQSLDQYQQLVYYTLLFQMDRSLYIQIVMVLDNME